MSALIQWLTHTFGLLGAAGIVIVLLVILGYAVRSAFWTVVVLVVAWKAHADSPDHMEADR